MLADGHTAASVEILNPTQSAAEGTLRRTPCAPAGVVARRVLLAGMTLLLAACASPAARFDEEAAARGFLRQVVRGTEFAHVVYYKPGRAAARGPLHVYLGGDGSPWIEGRWIAADPTPRNPLTLRLMALDPAPSVYLGRPCYQGLAQTPPCTSEEWTVGRYSSRVVASMLRALRAVMAARGFDGVVLIGYSGGGTLAMLLAARLADVRAVLTVAANLDPEAWAAYHGYAPLSESLNPAQAPPLPSGIVQMHLVGGRDQNVPAALLRSALARQPHARLLRFPGFDHVCCWEREWPSILDALAARLH